MNDTTAKTLIIVRHGHRDKDQGSEADNGLSPKGKKQAEEIKKYFLKKFKAEVPQIYSSPKLRCVETVEPLAKAFAVRIMKSSLLIENEGFSSDSPENFQKRIEDFVNLWKHTKVPLTVACSHGDLIPVLFEVLTGKSEDLKKGAWAEIGEGDGGHFVLKKLIQKFE